MTHESEPIAEGGERLGHGVGARERAGRAGRLVAAPLQFGRDWLVRFVALQGFDRAVALAGQAFTALVPLLIVYSAIVSQRTGRDFADELVRVFGLKGAAASDLRRAFAPPTEVTSQVSALGAFLLITAALSFTRALQRLYQFAWDQPSLGLRAGKWGLIWLAAAVLLVTLRPIVLHSVHGALVVVLSLVFAATFWLVTPAVLLARRVAWRRLLPTALLTGFGMTALSICSAIWMPRSVAKSAQQFGVMGVAFAILGWLVAAGFVLVAGAACGAVIDKRLSSRKRRRAAALTRRGDAASPARG
jgi:membrane protein